MCVCVGWMVDFHSVYTLSDGAYMSPIYGLEQLGDARAFGGNMFGPIYRVKSICLVLFMRYLSPIKEILFIDKKGEKC